MRNAPIYVASIASFSLIGVFAEYFDAPVGALVGAAVGLGVALFSLAGEKRS